MADTISYDDFIKEISCTYDNERYSVRDNGAVLRNSQIGKHERKYDNRWTFGKPNEKTGYLEIASVRVHRIVATAFHGVPPTKEHVVDHIDTNKWNNRPRNLRWITRLENVVLNPITAKRIAIVCGSVEAFLADPSKFRDKFQEPNFKWMRTVTNEEAQISYERLVSWAKSDKNKNPIGGSLDQWLFNRSISQSLPASTPQKESDVIKSKTENALQRNWRLPSEFPCCPEKIVSEPIQDYAEKLKVGSIFCSNDFYTSVALKSVISDNGQSLYVLSESAKGKDAVKSWALAKITYERNLFVHKNVRTFLTLIGAEKQYCLAQGLEWTGGDSIDDYC